MYMFNQEKDSLDSFFTQPLDQFYQETKMLVPKRKYESAKVVTLSPMKKKILNSPFKKENETTSSNNSDNASTDGESESNSNTANSFFKNNCFEIKRSNLKISEVLKDGWEKEIQNMKNKMMEKLISTVATPPTDGGNSKTNAPRLAISKMFKPQVNFGYLNCKLVPMNQAVNSCDFNFENSN
jgi:hypothetical protein